MEGLAVVLGAVAAHAGVPLAVLAAASGAWTVGFYLVTALIALGLLIFIHELGHFLVAKAAGVGVERFSLGFGPRVWAVRRGETEYCLSVIPLGGYVKMVGEEAHGEDLVHPDVAGAAELRANPAKSFVLKPLPVRALIVFAGPGMNFVLAAVIFTAIFAFVGVPEFPSTVGRVLPDSPAAEAGLRPGDEVVAIGGTPVRYWRELEERVAGSAGQSLALTVVRGGERRQVTVSPRQMSARTVFGEPAQVWDVGMRQYLPPLVGAVLPGTPAAEVGLQSGDRFVAIDGRPIETFDELAEIISQRPGVTVTLTIERAGERLEVPVTPRAETERDLEGNTIEVGRIGVRNPITPEYRRLDPLSAVGQGLQRTWDLSVLTVVSFAKLVTGAISPKNVGGPLQIGVLTGQAAQQGLLPYATLVAVISINLFILNLLPVPMLDGGHLLFFAIEAVQGRPLSLRKRELAQQIGLAFILLLIVFVFYNDLSRYLPIGQLFD